MARDDTLWIILHVPKCAGSTLNTLITHNFPRAQRECIGNRAVRQFRGRPLEDMRRAVFVGREDRIRFIYGHHTFYGLHEFFPDRPCRYVVFLRDPAHRVFSQYNYRRTQYELRNGKSRANGKASDDSTASPRDDWKFKGIDSFPEWFHASPQSRNYMLRCLVRRVLHRPKTMDSIHAKVPESDVTAKHLERVTRVLDSFHLVGITENPQTQLLLLHELGIRHFVPNQRVSGRYLSEDECNGYKDLVLSYNPLDQALYDYAVKRDTEFRATYPDADSIVTDMQARRESNKTRDRLRYRTRLILERWSKVHPNSLGRLTDFLAWMGTDWRAD